MKNLLIVGAGDWGLEIFSWLEDAHGFGSEWTFKGFLDFNLSALDKVTFCDYKVISNEDDYNIQENDVFLCAISDPDKRAQIVAKLKRKKASFISIIHKSVIFFKNTHVGEGVVLSPFNVVSNNVIIGNHVCINLATTIGHDVEIGDFSQINSHCDITGHVKMGEKVFLGSSVCIVPGVKIGNNAKIGAGSVVLRNIKQDQSVFGNPAKQIL